MADWPADRAADVTDPLARCSRCGARAIEHDFRDRVHLCAGTSDPFVSHELKRGCCMSDMSQPHEDGCRLALTEKD